jgi:hypothetical protein
MVTRKGVGPYTSNDTSFLRRDKSVDDSGNPRERRREIDNVDEGANGTDSGARRVTDARFGGGAMSRPVSSPKVKRYGP